MPNIIAGKRPSNTAREETMMVWSPCKPMGNGCILKNITTIITQEQKRARWFIGLRYFSHKWCWSSDTKACKNQATDDTGNWRWESGEPNNLHVEHCVEMRQGGGYNNINCRRKSVYIGFICEKKNWFVKSHSITFHSKLLGSFVWLKNLKKLN